ncbi:hypothetical protein, partial [Escherichia coli]|uniref:hypothetical protein n=4 Tax=Escherichia coli TaxID=562 RepID=UPI001F398B63
INCPDITGHKISIYRFTKIQAERPVFATTSTFYVLCRFSDIKNPLNGGLYQSSCAWFTSRYSFAKLSKIEAVYA